MTSQRSTLPMQRVNRWALATWAAGLGPLLLGLIAWRLRGRTGFAQAAATSSPRAKCADDLSDEMLWFVERPQQLVRRAGGRVMGLAFSSDGRRLATVTNTAGDSQGRPASTSPAPTSNPVTNQAAGGSNPGTGGELRLLDLADHGPPVIVPEEFGLRGCLRRMGRCWRPVGSTARSRFETLRPARRAERWEFLEATWIRWPFPPTASCSPRAVQTSSCRSGIPLRGRRFVLKGHEGGVTSVAFSPDGTLLVSGSSDATAKVWDVATGELRFRLLGHKQPVNCVGFSPNGMMIATGGDDGQVRFWDADSGDERQTTRSDLGQIRAHLRSRLTERRW